MLSPLYSESVIADRVREIAERMNADFKNADIVHVIVTLNGSFMFAADLVRQLRFPIVMHFAGATSYTGVERKQLRINAEALPPSFGNKPVILIEDIVDTGNTIGALRQMIAERFASEIKVAALLRRQSGGGKADYYGFTVPAGLFVVGYGLDLDGRYRELRDIKTVGVTTSTAGDARNLC